MERYPLHSLLSPLNAQEWRNLNENWDKIKAYFNSVQRQINILAGGEEVDEVLNRIEEAITNANTSVEEAISSLDDELQRVLSEIADQINLLTPIVNDAITATTNANTATANVGIALNELDAVIESYNVIGTWDSGVAYKKHNVVTYVGASYRALVDNTNVTVTDVDTWVLLAAKGEKGDTGSQGPQGVQGPQGIQGIKGDKGDKGEMGTGINIVGNLANPSELPSVGSLGDAYLINGNLYVWNGTGWEDAGNIQGPKGDKGDKGDTGAQGPQGVQGPKGDKGDKGDTGPAGSNANVTQVSIENALGYTPANQTDVTQHLDDDVKHITSSERTKWNTVGTVANLQTTNKTDLVSAINEVFQSGVNAKADVVTAVNAKGGTVTTSDNWSDIADAIDDISTGIEINGATDGTFRLSKGFDKGDLTTYRSNGFVDTVTFNTNPTGQAQSVAISEDKTIIAVAHSTSPFLTVYKLVGTTYQKIANPTTLSAGIGNDVCISADNSLIAIAHNTTPFVTVYSFNGTTLTKLANPDYLPAGTGRGVAISKDKTKLAVAHSTSTFFTLYSINPNNSFTKWGTNATLDTCYSASFNDESNLLIVGEGGSSTPRPRVYSIDDDNKTLSNFSVSGGNVAGSVNDIYFDNQTDKIFVAHNTSPFISIYESNGSEYNKLPNLSSLLSSNALGITFNYIGQVLAVGTASSPYIGIYDLIDNKFVLNTTVTIETTAVRKLKFSKDGDMLVLPCAGTPYIKAYKNIKKVYEPHKGMLNTVVLSESGASGSVKNGKIIWREDQ